MSSFGMNRFSSIETSKHVAPPSHYEILEWPRPVEVPPLTHVGVKLDVSRRTLNPVLMGEYENFHQSKGKFILWTEIVF